MRSILTILATAMVLTACAEEEIILPGERLPIRPESDGSVLASATAPASAETLQIALPAPRRLAAWPLRVGNAANNPDHATLSAAPQRVWTANIGAGDSRRLRITADPVSDGQAIYTMDAQSGVVATGLSGARIWSRSLVPSFERDSEASGGGLAVAGGLVFGSTGYGELHALDAATGAERWVQRLDAPITTPKVVDGAVYVVSRDGRAWSIDAETGRIRWDVPSQPSTTVMAIAPAPAVTERLTIFPFGSGELQAVLRQTGLRVWGGAVSGQRPGVAYGGIGDITGDPVVADGVLYAGTAAGRIVALEVASGTRVWTATDGAVSPITVAGGSAFAITDRAQLLRMDARTGEALWRQDLPFYRARRLARREGIFAHYGPVLAGGRLWVASSDGTLRGFDPATGALQAQASIPGGAASRPIAFGDVLYVTGRDGQLHAYR
ncbi:MAG: PQQ-binding-like beta-propeller repeat protein [Pseudomonadota bacterium]